MSRRKKKSDDEVYKSDSYIALLGSWNFKLEKHKKVNKRKFIPVSKHCRTSSGVRFSVL